MLTHLHTAPDPYLPPWLPAAARNADALGACAHRAAVEHIVSTVETEAIPVHLGDGSRWYDVRPMLSPHEQPPECIDRNRELLALGVMLGAVACMRDGSHLVHVNAA